MFWKKKKQVNEFDFAREVLYDNLCSFSFDDGDLAVSIVGRTGEELKELYNFFKKQGVFKK